MKVLKFGAVWCPGCLIMRPRWQELEEEFNELETVYYDADLNDEEFDKWQIGDTIPVCIFLNKDDEEIIRLIGEQPKKKLIELVNQYKDM